MLCENAWRHAFLIRIWTELDHDQPVLRGFIQDVPSGRKTYFSNLDLPVALLRESASALASQDRPPLH
jgi:hypothetical protein